MMIWELALLLVAITYMVINTVYMVVSLKMLTRYERIFTKLFGVTEKMIDKAVKDLEEDDL